MRNSFMFMLLSVAAWMPVQARETGIKFDGVQVQCVQIEGLQFGAGKRWPECSVTKGRWFATLDFQDMYQAQYCLGRGGGDCEQRALVVFSNRAYTPLAKVILKRSDPGTAAYEDPVLVQTRYGKILTLSAKLSDGSERKSYYRWQNKGWVALEASAWLKEVARQMPKGDRVTAEASPDADTMSARVLVQSAAGSPGRVAEVQLGLVNDRFAVLQVKPVVQD